MNHGNFLSPFFQNILHHPRKQRSFPNFSFFVIIQRKKIIIWYLKFQIMWFTLCVSILQMEVKSLQIQKVCQADDSKHAQMIVVIWKIHPPNNFLSILHFCWKGQKTITRYLFNAFLQYIKHTVTMSKKDGQTDFSKGLHLTPKNRFWSLWLLFFTPYA